MRGLFITGTDTGVGKTWAAGCIIRALLAAGRRAGAYKPVCSGAEQDEHGQPRWEDLDALCRALLIIEPGRCREELAGASSISDRPEGASPDRRARLVEQVCPQRFLAPLAPPVAAALEGRTVDPVRLRRGVDGWRRDAEVLIVEGAGGLLSPIADGETNADLAADLGWPVVVVAENRLGMVNHTLLTLECTRVRGLTVVGIVLNQITADGDHSVETNADLLARFVPGVPIWQLAFGGDRIVARDPPGAELDWWSIARDE